MVWSCTEVRLSKLLTAHMAGVGAAAPRSTLVGVPTPAQLEVAAGQVQELLLVGNRIEALRFVTTQLRPSVGRFCSGKVLFAFARRVSRLYNRNI